jgi:hypothetical protein
MALNPMHTVNNIDHIPKGRGRPEGNRLSLEDAEFLKGRILEVYCKTFAAFYEEATETAKNSKYKGFSQPNDVKTVSSAFANAFSGKRPLPELYWKVLEELLGIDRASLPSHASAKTEAPNRQESKTAPDTPKKHPTASATILVAISALGYLDKLYDPVYLFINKRADPFDQPEHRFKIEGDSQKIVVKLWGKKIQTITARDLKKLCSVHYEYIKTLEQSMKGHYESWQRIYPKRNSSPDKLKNEETDKEIGRLILNMEEDLIGIITFLQSIGLHLDDHYMNIRHLIGRFRCQRAV